MLDVGRLGNAPTMSHIPQRPAWVIEQTLDWHPFDCCGDADLFPFKCWSCACPLVLCYECETLYTDLPDLSRRRFPAFDDYSCPRCATPFDDDFMRSPRHRISFEAWSELGLTHLLQVTPAETLMQMLGQTADQLAGFLSRGMQSTVKGRLCEYRNLAEAISDFSPCAAALRARGQAAARGPLTEAIAWLSTFPEALDRSYALLGITDELFPPGSMPSTPPN